MDSFWLKGGSTVKKVSMVHCTACGNNISPEMKFCSQCGAPVNAACPSCSAENPPGSKFCGQCGAGLAAAATDPKFIPANAPAGADADKRQLTVLFIDLVGSTALSEQLDPEDLRELMLAYQGVCQKVTAKYEGFIAQYLGDGVLAYFGYPQAHEDDARRGVLTALGIVEELDDLNDELEREMGIRVSVRQGLHTGPVVIGDIGAGQSKSSLALGATPNVAARMQGHAQQNWVLISAATHKLVEGLFELEAIGELDLKGVGTPMAAYHVVGEREDTGRFEASARRGLAPLIGREEDLATMHKCYQQAKQGDGQVIMIGGEAGIGKSRIVQAFLESTGDPGQFVLVLNSAAFQQNSALYPVIQLLRKYFRFSPDESADERLQKLNSGLKRLDLDPLELMPIFAMLLSVPLKQEPNISPQLLRERTLDGIVEILLRLAEEQVLLLIVEDLHWLDPSSLDMLGRLIRRLDSSKIMLLCTYRLEFEPQWPLAPHICLLILDRLSDNEVGRLVLNITGNKPLSDHLMAQLIERTDGVPIFIEEVTKSLLEEGVLDQQSDSAAAAQQKTLVIPSSIQDSLTARLDRMGPAKEIAQAGSVLGRSFRYEMIRLFSGLDEPSLHKHLGSLVDAEILNMRGAPPDASYMFRHALIQEAAYSSLIKVRRRQYHQQIADTLSTNFPDIAESEPQLLAMHYTEANLLETAIDFWLRAGQRAAARSENLEAIEHLKTGLRLIESLPESAQRDRAELGFQSTLGTVLSTTQGYGAEAVEKAFQRALELSPDEGESEELFWINWGLGAYYVVRSDVNQSLEKSSSMLRIAKSIGDRHLLFQGYYALGVCLFFHGDPEQSRHNFDQGLMYHDEATSAAGLAMKGIDPAVLIYAHRAMVLWLLGEPAAALESGEKAVGLAREQDHPYSLSYALIHFAFVHYAMRDSEALLATVREGMALAQEYGFELMLGIGSFLMGGAMILQQTESGQASEDNNAIEILEQIIVAWKESGSGVWQSIILTMLAKALRLDGKLDEAASMVDQALAVVDQTEERFWEAELYRVRGEILLQQAGDESADDAAEASFRKALEVANSQAARALALRAAVSMARLRHKQNRLEEVQELLQREVAVYKEDFRSPDLVEARVILETLL